MYIPLGEKKVIYVVDCFRLPPEKKRTPARAYL